MPPKDFLEQDKEPAAGRIERSIHFQVESETPLRGAAELKKLLVPDQPPGAGRMRIDRQAVLKQAEGDVPMFAAQWVVKGRVLIDDPREPADGLAEHLVLLAALF